MTDKAKALQALIEKVEGKHGLLVIDGFSAEVFPPESAGGLCTFHLVGKAYNGSLDAAMALHEAVLPGWVWMVANTDADMTGQPTAILVRLVKSEGGINTVSVDRDCPARAFLLAILRALEAQEADA